MTTATAGLEETSCDPDLPVNFWKFIRLKGTTLPAPLYFLYLSVNRLPVSNQPEIPVDLTI